MQTHYKEKEEQQCERAKLSTLGHGSNVSEAEIKVRASVVLQRGGLRR